MLRTTAIIGLMLLYSFVVTCYSSYAVPAQSSFTSASHSSEPGSYAAVDAKILLCHTAPVESTITVVNAVHPLVFKNTFSDYTVFVRHTDRSFESKFLQYYFYSARRLIRLRQPDIVFPFHYFW